MAIQPILAVAAGLFLAFQSGEARPGKQLDELQGQWLLVETADTARVDRGDDSIRMTIKGNEIVTTFAGLTTNRGAFKAGLLNGVTTIDMEFANGRAVQGIYQLDGDTLTICIDEADRGRPSTLAPSGTQWMEKWKRAQP